MQINRRSKQPKNQIEKKYKEVKLMKNLHVKKREDEIEENNEW